MYEQNPLEQDYLLGRIIKLRYIYLSRDKDSSKGCLSQKENSRAVFTLASHILNRDMPTSHMAQGSLTSHLVIT